MREWRTKRAFPSDAPGGLAPYYVLWTEADRVTTELEREVADLKAQLGKRA